jgi:hypothetical protein
MRERTTMRARALAMSILLGLSVPYSSAGERSSHMLNLLQLRPLSISARRSGGSMLQRMRGGGGGRRGITSKFEVRVETTKPGDTVVMLGAGDVMRSWDKTNAIELKTTAADFPWWSAEVEVPIGEEQEFKFAIRSARGEWTWEPIPPAKNRLIIMTHDDKRDAVINEDGKALPVRSFVYGDMTPQLDGARGEDTTQPLEPWFPSAPAGDDAEIKPSGLLGLLSPRKRKATRSSSPAPQTPIQPELRESPIKPELHESPIQPELREDIVSHANQPAGEPDIDQAGQAAPETPASDAPAATKKDVVVASVQVQASKKEKDAVVESVQVQAAAGKPANENNLLQNVAMQLLRVLVLPFTIPTMVVYKSLCATATLVTRIFMSMHSIIVEHDPDKFERILLRNIHYMEGSMRSMNSSLTSAMHTVDKQMGDVQRLEKLWELEHQRYLTALDERKSAETEVCERHVKT